MIAKKNERGFSLIELLLALTLLSIVSLSFFGFFSQAFLGGKKSEDKLVAVNLAREYAKIGIGNTITINCSDESLVPPHQLTTGDVKFCLKSKSSPTINSEVYSIYYFGLDNEEPGKLKRVVTQIYIDEQKSPIAETFRYID